MGKFLLASSIVVSLFIACMPAQMISNIGTGTLPDEELSIIKIDRESSSKALWMEIVEIEDDNYSSSGFREINHTLGLKVVPGKYRLMIKVTKENYTTHSVAFPIVNIVGRKGKTYLVRCEDLPNIKQVRADVTEIETPTRASE